MPDPVDPVIPPADPAAASGVPSAPDAPPSGALDQASLGDYVRRRDAGERPGVPSTAPAPPGEPSDKAADPPLRPGETPEQAAAAKASRNRGSLQSRIDTLVRERGDFESLYHGTLARLQALEAKANGNGNGHAPPPQAPQPLPGPPQLDAFLAAGHTYEDWIDARITHQAQEIARAELLAYQAYQQQTEGQRQLQTALSTFQERVTDAKAKLPDYDTVVANNSDVLLSPVMQHVLVESPRGPELMYWLGKHPQVANELGEMTKDYPPAAFPLVEKHLLAQLPDAGAPRGASAAAPSMSTAPAPITPLGGGSTPIAPALDQLSLGDFVRRRNAELAQRKGR